MKSKKKVREMKSKKWGKWNMMIEGDKSLAKCGGNVKKKFKRKSKSFLASVFVDSN
jgi:hypothetical protein